MCVLTLHHMPSLAVASVYLMRQLVYRVLHGRYYERAKPQFALVP